jgi:hypothetical protein
MASQPSAKRKRSDESKVSMPEKGMPYFDDGNIILAVKNTHFRVYRGFLATLSPVFRDMFALFQPPKGDILVDGCPVVELDDLIEDWHTILNAIFPRYSRVMLFNLESLITQSWSYHKSDSNTWKQSRYRWKLLRLT